MLCISDVSDMGLHVGDMSLLAHSPHLGDREYNFCLNENYYLIAFPW